MAAAKAVVDVIEQDRLMDNAAAVGGHFRARLDGLAEKHAAVGEVRGMGLMQGIELVKDRQTKEPAPQAAAAVMEAAKDRGLIIGKGGLFGNVLRISPAAERHRGGRRPGRRRARPGPGRGAGKAL